MVSVSIHLRFCFSPKNVFDKIISLLFYRKNVLTREKGINTKKKQIKNKLQTFIIVPGIIVTKANNNLYARVIQTTVIVTLTQCS